MKLNFPYLVLCLLISMGLSSCADKSGIDPVEDSLSNDIYTKNIRKKAMSGKFATCDLDTEALAQILRIDVSEQIDCLNNSLDLFIELVETEKPGYLSYKRLSEFIVYFKKDVDDGTINALGGIFDLATLLFGEEQGYIAKDNVKPLMELLLELNQIFVEGDVYNLFTTKETMSFNEHNLRKSQVYEAFRKLSIKFRDPKKFKANNKEIDLLKFLLRFESIGNSDIIENAKSLLFLKKAILGGKPGVITAGELKRAAELFPDLSKVIFDFVNLPDTGQVPYQDEQMLKIYREDVVTAKNNFFYKDQPDEVIFTYYDIKQFVDRFFPEMSEFFIYKDSILKGKEVLFKNNSEDFTSEEILILLDDILYKTFDKGVYFYKYFAQNQASLLSPLPSRTNYVLRQERDYLTVQGKYIKDFNRITQNYRFYIGNQYVPTFTYDYKRNARGIFEVAVFEDIVTRFYKKYGTKDLASKFGYSLSMEQLEVAMVEFSELFEGKGWITPGRVASTAETITLMTSLFFAQSDGDDLIEVEEFAEFIISMLSALSLSTDMYAQMGQFCKPLANGTYDSQCFRDNFRNLLKVKKDGIELGDYIPELRAYVAEDKRVPVNLDTYLTKVATFSRTCPYFDNGEERSMTEGDLLVTIAGLLAIEQSVLRFDTMRPKKDSRNFEKMNGVLTPKELDDAFKVYGPAVAALAPDFMQAPKRVKRLYQFILKFQKVPADFERIKGFRAKLKATKDGLHLLNFVFSPLVSERRRKSNADRMTFASVLKIIADNSPATIQMLEEDPEFCERMRDN